MGSEGVASPGAVHSQRSATPRPGPPAAAGTSRGSARGTGGGLVVGVTAAASPSGLAVTRAVRDAAGIGGVLALDVDRGDVDGVEWRLADTTSPTVADGLSGADAVVHVACADDLESALGIDAGLRRSRAVRSAQAVLTASAALGVAHVVVVTSAMVYGARPGGPVPVPENADLAADPDDGLVGDLLEVEDVAARAVRTHPGLRVTVVRPAALVGPGVDTVVTRHFEAPRLLTLRESQMLWQFCHVDDLGRAVAHVLGSGLAGPVTVGSSGAMSQAAVEAVSGMRRVELPAGLAIATAERLRRVGVLPMPAGDLSYVVNPWVVSSGTLRRDGWEPLLDNESCLRVLLVEVAGRRALASRRLERRDAALGAAGAAVAVMGTAAVWRQARSRRRRPGGRT